MNHLRDMRDTILAIIPARGGSKGIPRKNLIPLAGKPLLAHSIEHALASERITRVVVSTEDDEIAAVARRYGAEVPFTRPIELAGDEVLDWPVFAHVLEELERREQYQPDLIVHLRPTAPYRRPAWIDEAVDLLARIPDADSVRSVSPPTQHPYRVFGIDSEGFLQPILASEHPEPFLLRRQELPAMYYYNCVIDVTRPATIREQRSMTGRRMLPYIMDPNDVIDIDTHRDLRIARCLMEGSP